MIEAGAAQIRDRLLLGHLGHPAGSEGFGGNEGPSFSAAAEHFEIAGKIGVIDLRRLAVAGTKGVDIEDGDRFIVGDPAQIKSKLHCLRLTSGGAGQTDHLDVGDTQRRAAGPHEILGFGVAQHEQEGVTAEIGGETVHRMVEHRRAMGGQAEFGLAESSLAEAAALAGHRDHEHHAASPK